MATRDVILGLDLGTSSLKGIFINATGEILDKYEVAISLHREGEVVEQDAQEYLSAIAQLIDLDKRNRSWISQIKGIGLSGHTPSLVAIDEEGLPTAPVMIWQDNRAVAEARELEDRFGDPREIVGTSLPWSPSATAAKAFWLRRNRPESAAKTRWLLQPKDFLGFHLTGSAISDPWSTKGLCNVRTKSSTLPVLEFIQWSSQVVPELRDGFTSRGTTTSAAATKFGIPEGISVSVGWSDAMCGMLALGAFAQPASFIITGTSAIVGTSSATEPSEDQPLYVIPRGSAPYPVLFGPTQMSGGSISWAAKLFGISESDLVIRGASDQSNQVPIYLPYIAGERAPLWRNDIRGSFSDISISDGASSFARATMEGICFAERQVLELSQQLSNSPAAEIILSGKAGNDPHWLATRLRTMGQSLRIVNDLEITCRGSAILANAMLTGDLATSTHALMVSGSVHHPSPAEIAYGERTYNRFIEKQRSLLAE